MKAEINLENKVKFFALYWGQEVFSSSMLQGTWDYNGENFDEIGEDDFLSLKPLSSITDEDAIELAKIFHVGIGKSIFDDYINFKEYKDSFIKFSNVDDDYCHSLVFFDYLRSKGYALPWMGLSVDEMVESNWIKIK